jgi:hypothetical protein
MNLLRYVLIAAALSSTTSYAMAEVTRIEIATRTDVLAGKAFGETGPYEEIVGKVYYSLDPDNPRNKSIADLDKAPRDAAGRVAFVADLFVLAPKDKSHGNGVALFDVLNRGRKNMLNAFNRSPPSFDPNAPLDLGDRYSARRMAVRSRQGRPDRPGQFRAVYLKGGFQPGHFYELSYQATGAVVAGVGLAALRDLASAVKYRQDLPITAGYAYAFGPSQDGRLLREFLYEGFNADEQDRRAFDAVMAHIAGAARGGDFNSRFARPNGLGFFVASLFPYLDLDQKDPATGRTDGIETKLTPEQRPKIFYTNSSGEYWGGGRAAALTHTTLDSSEDAMAPDNVRIYLFAGTQHVPGGYLPSQGAGAQKPNGKQYGLRSALSLLRSIAGSATTLSRRQAPIPSWRTRPWCRATRSHSLRFPVSTRRSLSRPATGPISPSHKPMPCRSWCRRLTPTAMSCQASACPTSLCRSRHTPAGIFAAPRSVSPANCFP